ncbi:MAG TPA: hypothetical protein VM639_04715 [Dongiaceae bacterium]|nr:hypothetical protein [Dongiaceae bacterium]
MGAFTTCRIVMGINSRLLRNAAAALTFSALAITLSACQAPANLASTAVLKTQPHPPQSTTSATTALAMLGKSDQQLVGLADRDLTAALGEPNHVRHDEPATIWQYAASDCVVDFYLYQAAAGLQVAYVEARDRKAQTEVTHACMQSLLQPSVAAADKIPLQKTADATN